MPPKYFKELTRKVVVKLPPESAKYAVRDITLLTSSIFGKTHFDSFKKIFDADFSIIFWFVRKDGNAVFHRSGSEYDSMSKKIGDEYVENHQKAKKVARKLIEMSDTISKFIKTNKKLGDLISKRQYFSKLYMDFFAYHQAVFWPSVYLSELPAVGEKKKKIDRIIKTLDHAYKYNERVIPNVEKYFRKFKIGHLVFDEVNEDVLKNIKGKAKRRSVLFLDNKMFVFPFREATAIDKEIMERYRKYLGNLKGIKGLAVSPGFASGRVKLIGDLKKLKEVKKGDILVVSQTRPQYNSFVKNAAAIVTDEGGLLSHASILARETGIPCIVGTKNASHVLKSGDLVEVDADVGEIRIIERR